MKLRTLFVVIAISLVAQFAAQTFAAQAPAAGQEQKKQITDPAEYNAYMAALNEKDAAKKIQLVDEFLTKYPNTVVKADALEVKMVTQLQAGQNPEATAKQLLAADPNNIRGLLILANLFLQGGVSETDPALQQKLADAEQIATKGLQVLPNFNPPNVNADELKKTKDAGAATFHQELAIVNQARKQWGPAQEEFVKAGQLSPDDGALFYRMGVAYLSERPDPKYSQAFWAFARAATLEGPGGLPPASRQSVEKYLRDTLYVKYHGSEMGLDELKAQAKAAPFPPADFHVQSKAEVAAAAPLTPEQVEKMGFDEKRDMLLAGTPKSEQLWSMMKDKTLKMNGMVVSATPEARPKVLRLAVLQETAKKEGAYDVELTLAAPVLAAKAPAGKVKEFSGTVSEYSKDPFVLKLTDGKLAGEEAPPAAKKPPVRKRPAR